MSITSDAEQMIHAIRETDGRIYIEAGDHGKHVLVDYRHRDEPVPLHIFSTLPRLRAALMRLLGRQDDPEVIAQRAARMAIRTAQARAKRATAKKPRAVKVQTRSRCLRAITGYLRNHAPE